MDECAVKITKTAPEHSRNRSIQREKHKRIIKKRKLYSAKGLPEYPRCNHNGSIQCKSLSMADIKYFYDLFYSKQDKIFQDTIIYKYCNSISPKRSRIRNNERGKKGATFIYNIRKQNGTVARVCRDTFLRILDIKKDRVHHVLKQFQLKNGAPPVECRGGDRIKNKNDKKKQAISNFVESITCAESHYCRSSTLTRVYLPCELNIRILSNMYNSSVELELRVKESYFRNYVNTHYNIGFGTPQTDMCSECLQFAEKIKIVKDENMKKTLITMNRVHKLKAAAFFSLLKEENASVECFSFDCQKNLALPKLADQCAYFSQQYNFYNFTIVRGTSNAKLNPNNVTSYVWTDTNLPKNSSVISSAIYHTLSNYNFPSNITTIRLFADGCGGQNKNSIVIGMLCNWLHRVAPKNINEIHFIFPMVGHSFMPPDRVFGLIERQLKKTNKITAPIMYIEIIKKFSKVLALGKDWQAFDWKSETTKCLKQPGNWHFQFNSCKRFIIKKSNNLILVQGEPLYKSDIGAAKSVMKRGRKIEMLNPDELSIGRAMDPQKAVSVQNLLKKHYGEKWREEEHLKFYKNIIDSTGIEGSQETPEEDVCEFPMQVESV